MLVSQSGLSALAQEALAKRMGIRDVRLLMEMMANTGYENLVMVSQMELGRLQKMDKAAVSAAIRRLLAAGFIERVNDRRGWYRIAPKFAWKGAGDEHREVLAGQEEAAYLEKFTVIQGKEVA